MRALCVLLACLACCAAAHGAAVDLTEGSVLPDPPSRDIPQTVWFQGFVEDSGSGEPIDATYDMVAEILDAETDGASLWGPETHPAVSIVGGWFNIELGATVDLPTFDGAAYYLELTINSEVLAPRQKLGSVPAAFRSARTDDVDDDWLYSGGHIYRMSGNIGVGTAAPERDLDVAGTVRMDAFEMVPGAADGHVLTSDGVGVGTWQSPPDGGGLDLPYSGSTSHTASAFSVDNTNSGTHAAAINGKHTLAGNYGRLGTGTAGVLGVGSSGWAGYFAGGVLVEDRLGIGIDPTDASLGVVTNSGYGTAIYAYQSETSGPTRGVQAYVNSQDGKAVLGANVADSLGVGVYGLASGPKSTGVLGESTFRGVTGVNTMHGTMGALGSSIVGVYGDGATSGFAGYFVDGNVHVSDQLGVGTTAPEDLLHIRSDVPDRVGVRIENRDPTGESYEGIFFEDENGSHAGLAIYDDSNSYVPNSMRLYNMRTNGWLEFHVAAGEAMRIDDNGRVAIGTDLPEHKLNVVSQGGAAVYGRADVQGEDMHYGVYGETESWDGYGVYGESPVAGVAAYNTDTGTYGRLATGNAGVWGWQGSSAEFAGYFEGEVVVTGDLGIGTSAPASELDVHGLACIRGYGWPASETGASMELAYNPTFHRGYIQVFDRNTGGSGWGQLFLGDGTVGIGAGTDYSHELDVAGDIQCVALHETSDGRYKSDVRELTNALDAVGHLRGVSFEWNDASAEAGATPGERGIGVIAEEVQEVFPELVSAPEGSPRSVDYSKLTAVLIEAVKELRAENEELSARLEVLEAERSR